MYKEGFPDTGSLLKSHYKCAKSFAKKISDSY